MSFVAFLGMLVVAGYVDYLTWGTWFVSYYNNYVFNMVYGVSEQFGVENTSWYLRRLLAASMGLFAVVFLLGIVFVSRLWILLASVFCLVLVHCIIPHKEYRFLFSAIPLLLILTACVSVLVIKRLLAAQRERWAAVLVMVSVGVISAGGLLGLLPFEQRVFPQQPLYVRDDVLMAYDYLAADIDLKGLLVQDFHWRLTGGYYHLHRNIPIYYDNDERRMYEDGGKGPASYVSHILCKSGSENLAGFVTIAQIGGVEIRRQSDLPAAYDRLPSYSRNVWWYGVDGKIPITVQPMKIDSDPP